LIVAPTHGECRQIATAVRQVLKKEGVIAGLDVCLARLPKGETNPPKREIAFL
jgi:hypothetical protein